MGVIKNPSVSAPLWVVMKLKVLTEDPAKSKIKFSNKIMSATLAMSMMMVDEFLFFRGR